MPTYILDENATVRLPRGPLMIEVNSRAPVHLRAVRDGGDVGSVVRPTTGLMILTQVPARTVISVAPELPLRAFGADERVSLTLSVERRGELDPDRVFVSSIDVAGLGTRDLVSVEPDDRGLVIAGLTDGGDEESTLSPLAEESRVSAREILTVDRVPPMAAVNVVIALDQTASMRPLTLDGSVAAVVDILVGLSRVLCTRRKLGACLLTDPVTWVDTTDEAAFAAALVEQALVEPAAVGFRSAAPSLRGFSPDENTVVYLVTDAFPADLDALTREDRAAGEARHLVLVGERSALETAAVRSPVPFTIVNVPPRRTGPADALLRSPSTIREIVGSLLVGCFAPGTPLAAKVIR